MSVILVKKTIEKMEKKSIKNTLAGKLMSNFLIRYFKMSSETSSNRKI